MKRVIVLVVALVALLPAASVGAQEGDECDLAALKARFSDAIQQAETLDDLNALSTEIATTLAACEPKPEAAALFSFEGTGNGVAGPFDLLPGLYMISYAVHNEAGQYVGFELDLQHPSDSWGHLMLTWRPVTGRVPMRVRTGGTSFINVESEAPWSLSITPFDTTTQTELLAFSGDTADDVWGPVVIEEGYYRMEFNLNPDPQAGFTSFHFALLEAENLNPVEYMNSDHYDPGDEIVVFLESGEYLFQVGASGGLDWTAQLVPAE